MQKKVDATNTSQTDKFKKNFRQLLDLDDQTRLGVERLLTPFETGIVIRKSSRTVTRMIIAGELPALRVRGSWLIQPVSLRAWPDEQERKNEHGR